MPETKWKAVRDPVQQLAKRRIAPPRPDPPPDDRLPPADPPRAVSRRRPQDGGDRANRKQRRRVARDRGEPGQADQGDDPGHQRRDPERRDGGDEHLAELIRLPPEHDRDQDQDGIEGGQKPGREWDGGRGQSGAWKPRGGEKRFIEGTDGGITGAAQKPDR